MTDNGHSERAGAVSRGRPERNGTEEPLYPILNLGELPDTKDRREELPFETQKYLRPEEKVVHTHTPEVIWPGRRFSGLEICMKAAGVSRPEDLGEHGPTVASVKIIDERLTKSRYEVQHGRDDLQAAVDLYPMYPKLLDATIVSLADRQGVKDEEYVEGQPYGFEKVGSIILLNREPNDPVGQKFVRRASWKYPFYASVDAPLSFINAIYLKQQQDPSYLFRKDYHPRDGSGEEFTLSAAFERSCLWQMLNLAENRGLIAYTNPVKGGGMRNQGWRDSAPAMVHKNGDWANTDAGVAPIEVQGLAYDSLRNSARIYRAMYGNHQKAKELDALAEELQRTVLQHGFVSDSRGGYFVSGFDRGPGGELRPLKVLTSAAGRLLDSEMLKSDHPDIQEMIRQTISALLGPDMLTRWGIRTLSSREAAYVPFLYHNGPVWMYDTNEIAKAFSAHGYYGLDRLVGALTSNQHDATGVFYEHISGYDSEEPMVPRRDTYVYNQKYGEIYMFEQVPPRGQTWSASTEEAKKYRYSRIPLHATVPGRLKFEKKIWRNLPDHIQALAGYYEPHLAMVLSGGSSLR